MSSKYMRNVFNWEYMCLYLSGPMDFDRDQCGSWRDVWTRGLIDICCENHNEI